MADPTIIEALQVVIKNTKATEQAVINQHTAVVTALHQIAQKGGIAGANAQQSLNGAAAGNPLAGYTTSAPGHVPGSGAPQPVAAPAAGGASTGYSQPPVQPAAPGGGGGGGVGQGGGGGQGGGQPGGGQPGGYGQPLPVQGGVLQRLLTGNQPGGMPGGRAGAILGGIGVANEIYKNIVGFTEDASRYQGMMGGTNRIQGAGELLRERLYSSTTRLFNPNGLSGQEAAQAFANVTSAGYRDKPGSDGLGRENVLDFYQRNKTNMGMTEQESSAVMNTMIRNGAADSAEGLEALSDALHQVSDAAGAAGVNALLARQNFLTMFQGLTNAGAGAGATSIAAAGAASLAQYGRSMQNIDQSAQFGEDFQFRMAARNGMSVGAYQNLMRKDPAAAQSMVDRNTSQSIMRAVGPQAVQWIKQTADGPDFGGVEAISRDPELLQDLADRWQDAFEPNLIRLRDIIQSTTGVTVEEGQVTKWVVGHVLGLDASGRMKEGAGGKATTGSALRMGADGKATAAGGGAANSASVSMLAPSGSGNTGQSDTAAGGRRLDSAQRAYRDHVKSQGAGYRDPMIEKVLEGTKDRDGTKVLIETMKGPRVMTLAEALKHYPEAVAAGKAVFIGKDNKAQNFKEVAGVNADSGRTDEALKEKRGNAGQEIGVAADSATLAAAQEAQDRLANEGSEKAGETTGMKVVVEPSDELKKWLKFDTKPVTGSDAETGARPDPNVGTGEGVRSYSGYGRGR